MISCVLPRPRRAERTPDAKGGGPHRASHGAENRLPTVRTRLGPLRPSRGMLGMCLPLGSPSASSLSLRLCRRRGTLGESHEAPHGAWGCRPGGDSVLKESNQVLRLYVLSSASLCSVLFVSPRIPRKVRESDEGHREEAEWRICLFPRSPLGPLCPQPPAQEAATVSVPIV